MLSCWEVEAADDDGACEEMQKESAVAAAAVGMVDEERERDGYLFFGSFIFHNLI